MTTNTSSALLGCPFCGGTRLESGGDDKYVGTRCLTCEASGPNHYGPHDWNTRSAATAEPVAWWADAESNLPPIKAYQKEDLIRRARPGAADRYAIPLYTRPAPTFTKAERVQIIKECAKVAEEYDGDGLSPQGYGADLGDARETQRDIVAAILALLAQPAVAQAVASPPASGEPQPVVAGEREEVSGFVDILLSGSKSRLCAALDAPEVRSALETDVAAILALRTRQQGPDEAAIPARPRKD